MTHFANSLILCGLLQFNGLPLFSQDCVGPGDIDGDGAVAVTDLAPLAECLAGPDVFTPPPGCDPIEFARADLDEDGDVDLADVAKLLPYVGQEYFAYGPHRENLEAEMLAMDVTGQLRAPDQEYERIRRDLALIRATYPQLQQVIDDTDYVPNQLMVGLDNNLPHDGYKALNEYYLVVSEQIYYSFRLLTFCDNLNAPVLAPQYAALPEVQWAEPNGLIGIDDFITVTVWSDGTYWYDIDDGFMDCFDGCDCHRVWALTVSPGGTVTLVSYYEWGMPWCDFGSGVDG